MQKITKGRRLIGTVANEFSQEAKRAYDGGKTVRAIMAESGRSYGAVHRALRRAVAVPGTRRGQPWQLGRCRVSSKRSPRRGQDGPRWRTPGKKKSRHHDVVILAVLHGLAPLKLRQIAGHAHILYQVAHRTLTSLYSLGHVTRTEDGTQRKQGQLCDLTTSGRLYCVALGVGLRT